MWYIYNFRTEINDLVKFFFCSAEAQSRKSHRRSYIENTDILKSANRKLTLIPLIY